MKRFFDAIAVASVIVGALFDSAAGGLSGTSELGTGASTPASVVAAAPASAPSPTAQHAATTDAHLASFGTTRVAGLAPGELDALDLDALSDHLASVDSIGVPQADPTTPPAADPLSDWATQVVTAGDAPAVELPLPAAPGDTASSIVEGPLRDAPAPSVDLLRFAGAAGGEGIAIIGADAWHETGYRGAGSVVAVIDTGFGDWDRAVEAGDVPAVPADRRLNYCDRGFEAKNHGTGTSEIVHDIAPDASLVLVCIDDAADLALAVDRLPGLGVDIVNMSLGFYNTARGDGTGGPGSPDDSVRRTLAAGIMWVNSAGNEAPHHWSGTFTDDDGNGFGSWAPGSEFGSMTVAPGATVEVHLRWDEWPLRDDGDRFALCFLVDPTRPPSCRATPEIRGTPTLGLALTNPRPTPVVLQLAVQRLTGSGAPQVDLFLKGATDWQFPVLEGSLLEPAAVAGIVTVGATCTDTGDIQPYSSRGRTLDGRPGVGVAAPGAVSGLLFGPVSACRGGYGGTSAAAPHAAGALALLRQLDPHASGPALVEELFTRTASMGDPGEPGVDPVYGHGRLHLGAPPPFAPNSDNGGHPAAGLGIAWSPSPSRLPAEPLDGDVVAGDLYAFVTPTYPARPVAMVRFFVDGVLVQVERQAGYDLGGGRWDRSYPFDTFRLRDGRHRLDVVVTFADGGEQPLSTTFVVDNGDAVPPPSAGILLLGDVPLERAVVAAPAAVRLAPGPGWPGDPAQVRYVLFYVDAVLVGYDDTPTYTLAPDALAALAEGQHMVQAIVELADGTTRTVNASFTVRRG